MALELEDEVGVEEYAERTGVSSKTVRRKIDSGELSAEKRGGKLYLKAPVGETSSPEGVVVTELVNALKDSRRHTERAFELVLGPMVRFTEQVHANQEKMLSYNIQLQEKVLESTQVVERLLSEEHDRRLKTLEVESRNKRLDAAFELLKGVAPDLLAGITAGKGINVRKMKAAERVLSALPLDAVEMLLSAEGEDAIIPPEVREDALVLLDEMRKEAAAKPAQQTNAPSESVADGSGGASIPTDHEVV